MHINTANAILQKLRYIKAEVRELQSRAEFHDALALVELLDGINTAVDVSLDWLRAAHHER